jgi:predicted CopG family antitoxin
LTVEEHVEYNKIKEAVESISQVCSSLNEQKKKAEMIEMMWTFKITYQPSTLTITTPVIMTWSVNELVDRYIQKKKKKRVKC